MLSKKEMVELYTRVFGEEPNKLTKNELRTRILDAVRDSIKESDKPDFNTASGKASEILNQVYNDWSDAKQNSCVYLVTQWALQNESVYCRGASSEYSIEFTKSFNAPKYDLRIRIKETRCNTWIVSYRSFAKVGE